MAPSTHKETATGFRFEIPAKPLAVGPGRAWLSRRDLPNNVLTSLAGDVFIGPKWTPLALAALFALCSGLIIAGSLNSRAPTWIGFCYMALWVTVSWAVILLGQRAVVRFDDGKVSYDGKSLGLRDQWIEPLENYDGIRVLGMLGAKKSDCQVTLVHPVQARSLILFSGLDPAELLGEAQRLAALLGVRVL